MFDFDPTELLKRENWTPSALMLVLGNFIAIAFALILGMDPSSVVWAYWLESIIIGVYTVLTFGAIGLRSISRRDWSGAKNSGAMGAFFAVHYGMFHAGYFLFLYILPWFTPNPEYFQGILLLASVFLITHGYSFFRNFISNPARLESTEKNLGDVMQSPYGRIIPMHIAIILSGFFIGPLLTIFLAVEEVTGGDFSTIAYIGKLGGLIVFMVLKTLADVAGHIARYKKGLER